MKSAKKAKFSQLYNTEWTKKTLQVMNLGQYLLVLLSEDYIKIDIIIARICMNWPNKTENNDNIICFCLN